VKQFESGQVVIGHDADVQLDLGDKSVSPLHCVIEERESGYYISDLGSQSGTILNGKKVLDERLESGDEIRVGIFRLQFFIGVPKPAAPPSKSGGPPPVKAQLFDKNAPKIPKSTPDVKDHKPPTTRPRAAPSRPLTPVVPSEKTFAPPSSFKDANEIVRPSKGTVVEVLVAWKERIIATKHFSEAGVVTIGADPEADLVVPIMPAGSLYPLVRIHSLASIAITADMPGELVRENGSTSFSDLFRQNRMRNIGTAYELDIPQGEMARIGFQGNLLSVYVRYVPETPKPLVAPLLDLTTSEVTGVVLAAVVAAIFGLYMLIYAPMDLEDEARLEEPIRKAVVTFKAPIKKEIVQVEEPPQEKKQVVQIVEKQRKTQTPTADAAGKPGKAAEIMPKKTQVKKKEVTSVRQGGAIQTAPKEGAQAKAVKPDPNSMGLLGVFGSKGAQKTLDKTFSGAGELRGEANTATGFAGSAENRPGDGLGSKFKDTGAGGKGTATVGISGLGTKGKGTGNYGTGVGGIGTKGSVNIDVGGQEAEFVGSIDREAIRRIIQQNKAAIRSCYERSLQRKPDLYGKLVLEWDIEERGRVTRTAVKSNSLGDAQVASCILARIKTLRFPEPPPDQIGRVTFPFVFSSQ